MLDYYEARSHSKQPAAIMEFDYISFIGGEMLIQLEIYSDLASKIEAMVEENGLDYIDAVLTYCEQNDIDVEFIGELIAKNSLLKSKIEMEAENLHFIKPVTRLPI